MIYLQKRVIDQNGRSPSSFEKAKIRCGMTGKFLAWIESGKFKFGHELIAVKKFFNKDYFIIPSKRGIPIRFLESFLNKNFGYKTDSSKPKNYYRDGPGSVRSKRAVKIAYLPNDISYWLTKKLASQ